MDTELRPTAAWVLPAVPSAVSQLRHQAAGFAAAASASAEMTDAITLAVSETVTNVVLHAYDGEKGQVRLSCGVDGECVIVEVVDEGRGIVARHDSPGIGYGLAMVGALAQSLDIAVGPNGRGTTVTMSFSRVQALDAPPGLEALCPLAIDTVADASSVLLVREGVLRRVAAEVAGEPALSAWLRAALPPAKPGTATWAALREGGARLVVHDPALPRSPGGPGERLSLTWWVAIRLESPGGGPAALWGLGGREGGRPVPSEELIQIISDAARGDLAQPAARALLGARLASACRS